MIMFMMIGMEKTNKEARGFAKQQNKEILKRNSVDNNPILSQSKNENPPSRVDDDTRFMMDTRSDNKGDSLEDDKLIEGMIKQGDKIVEDPTKPLVIKERLPSSQDQIVECFESEIVPQTSFYRTLNLDVFHQDQIIKKVCKRKIQRCFGNANHDDDEPECTENKWIEGPTVEIETYEDCGSKLGWRFYDACEKEKQPEKTELKGEKWDVEDPYGLLSRVQRNECNIVRSDCIEGPSSKTYFDKSFHRECWRQKITVMCPGDTKNTCAVLRKKGCEEVDQKCTQYSPDGRCETYTKHYRCPIRKKATLDAGHDKIHCIDGGSLINEPKEYEDMAESLAQLAVLGEMQNELGNLKDPKVFKGQSNRCKKNICGDLLYDCCAKKGLALNLSLTNCNAEEEQLSTLRAEGKCHYIGYTPNQFMGLWTSSDTHVFCCYPSKLVLVLQKEARKQLGKNFGSAQSPDCDGLSMEDITKLDFSKMDLSELFDDIMKKAKKTNPKIDLKKAEARMREKIKDLKIKVRR